MSRPACAKCSLVRCSSRSGYPQLLMRSRQAKRLQLPVLKLQVGFLAKAIRPGFRVVIMSAHGGCECRWRRAGVDRKIDRHTVAIRQPWANSRSAPTAVRRSARAAGTPRCLGRRGHLCVSPLPRRHSTTPNAPWPIRHLPRRKHDLGMLNSGTPREIMHQAIAFVFYALGGPIRRSGD